MQYVISFVVASFLLFSNYSTCFFVFFLCWFFVLYFCFVYPVFLYCFVYCFFFCAVSFYFCTVPNLKIKIYRTIILPIVLYGCETWLLTLREERKLRVFENMVLRRTFGPRRDEVTGEWRRLHKELNDLYCSPNSVRVIKWRRMRWAGHVACMGEEREAYRVLLGKPEGRRPLGRPRHRWVDNIRMISRRLDVGIWTGLGWPRIETGGRRL